MEQPELGKNEEEETNDTSSAELSESETAPTDTEEVDTTSDDVEDTPTDTDDAEDAQADVEDDDAAQPAAETESDDGDEDVAATDTDDEGDDDEDGPEEENGLTRGEVLKGTISRTTPNEIYVDLGDDREGMVPKREVEMLSGKMLGDLNEGEEVHVYVVNPSNHKGDIILSINHAQEELDWRKAEEYMENKTVYDGKIGGYNKGGLIVRFGRLRGFVPQSQISDKRMLDVDGETPEERFSDLVGDNISVKVMEVDRSRNRLILSERAAMREVRQRRKEALITELKEGEIRDGRVVSLENFGAFVDVGGAEGLVHITELSWKHVTHPRQVLDVGQEVEVKVISIDEDRNRIGLSIKQLKADPWDEIAAELRSGSLIRGKITKLTKFGAFARVQSKQAVEGLIHISELSDERVEHPRDVVQKGDELTLRVVKVDVKNRRLGLSLRRVNSPEFLDQDLQRAYDDAENRDDEEVVEDAVETVEEDDTATDVEEAAEEAQDTVEDAVDSAEDTVEDVVDDVEDAVEEVAEDVEEVMEDAEEAVEDLVDDVEDIIDDVTSDEEDDTDEDEDTADDDSDDADAEDVDSNDTDAEDADDDD